MSWDKMKLGNITKNLDSKRKPLNGPEREKMSTKKLYPYIGANNIMGYVDEYLFDEEILCIAEDGGSWGEGQTCCVYYKEKCWVNNHAHVLATNGKANLKFVHYYLNKVNLNQYITGSTRGKLTKTALESIEIPLPSLPIQKKIADILDKADALRKKDKQLLQKYDELAQAIFVDMFGDPVKNEKGWELKKLGDICEINSGGTPTRKRTDYFEGNIPWVKTTEVKGILLTDTEEKISVEALSNSSCKMNPVNSIIIAMYGQGKTRGNVGLLGIEAATNQACGVLKPNLKYNSLFIFFTLKMMYEELRKLGRGGNQENLNLNILKNFEIFFPSKMMQEVFAKKVNLFNKIETMFPNEYSESLFQSLLQQVFKGEFIK